MTAKGLAKQREDLRARLACCKRARELALVPEGHLRRLAVPRALQRLAPFLG